MRLPLLRPLALALTLALVATAAPAQDGHGPDAWRVTGVAAGDVLNGRMGPGTDYPVIERFAPDERGLQQVTCVPYLTFAHFEVMTEAERAALPPRWCLMQSADLTRTGWVNGAYIAEDSGAEPQATGGTGEVGIGWTNEPDVVQAMILVRDAFAANGAGGEPQGRDAGRYFFAADLATVRNAGADVLFDAQDVDGRLLRVYPHPEIPAMRGSIPVVAEFVNFGEGRRATFWLARDSMQAGAPIRILQIEHMSGATYP